MKEMQEIRKNAGGDPQEAMAKFQTLQKEAKEKIDSVLTDDQKKSWKDMCGEPFKFERRPRPGA